ncbi:MAG: hypothetical protein RLZZ200_2556 [Pseudomonadota bacterium]|jgi:DNA-binding Lrp family transcriptional regulator
MRKKLASRKKTTDSRPAPIDETDRRILVLLAKNARSKNVEIARKVGLSEASCSRRIQRMEDEGVIAGYTVRASSEALGIGITAFLSLTLDAVSAQAADRFVDAVMESPNVLSCYIVSGGAYALLHVAASDMQAYSEFVLDTLRRIPGVKDLNSNFVMRVVKETHDFPEVPARSDAGTSAKAANIARKGSTGR